MEDAQHPKSPQQPKLETTDQPKETPAPAQAGDLPGGEKKEDEKGLPEDSFDEKLRPKKTKARFLEERERKHQIAAGYGDEESNTTIFNSSASGLFNTGSGDFNNYTYNTYNYAASQSKTAHHTPRERAKNILVAGTGVTTAAATAIGESHRLLPLLDRAIQTVRALFGV